MTYLYHHKLAKRFTYKFQKFWISSSKTMKDPHRSSRINALEGAKPGVYWANLTYFDGVIVGLYDNKTDLNR